MNLLFNITTPVADIWSERTADYGLLVVGYASTEKHYRYEMNKRDKKVETWLQACMHRTMEYVDLFSCR